MADNEVGESQTPSDSLRDAINAAFTDDSAPETPVAEKTAPEATPEVPKEAESASKERPRGEDGKFLPKETAETAPKEPKPAEKAPEAPVAAPTEPKAAATTPDPTARWSSTDKAMFKTLPPAAQEFITRRYSEMEGDYTKKTQALADFRRTYEPVDALFAPFKQQMKSQGWTESSLIKAWADVEKDLMEGRGVNRVAQIVQAYRLPKDEIAKILGITTAGVPSVAPTGNEPQLDPAVIPLLEKQFGSYTKPLMEQLQALTSERDQQRAVQARLEQQRKDAEAATANQKVQDFINEKDGDGNASHPYFNDVSRHMVALATAERNAGRTPDLQAIYDQAVWAHPPTREKLLAAQQAAQVENARQESLKKAADAKKAAASVTGAPGSGHASSKMASAKPKSLRELIAEAADSTEA